MRPEKQLLLDEIQEKVESSKALIITKYAKLSPDTSWKLASTATPKNCYFEVVKKRILQKALENKKLKTEDLAGHIGVFFIGCDPMEGIKLFYNFKKENENLFEFISGHFEGKQYSPSELETLAKLPTQDEMRAQLLSLFVSPMTQTLSIMHNLLTGVIYCLENKSQKQE